MSGPSLSSLPPLLSFLSLPLSESLLILIFFRLPLSHLSPLVLACFLSSLSQSYPLSLPPASMYCATVEVSQGEQGVHSDRRFSLGCQSGEGDRPTDRALRQPCERRPATPRGSRERGERKREASKQPFLGKSAMTCLKWCESQHFMER